MPQLSAPRSPHPRRVALARLAQLALVLSILLLGAALRLRGLAAESLWTDELESWKQASYASLPDVVVLSTADIHPPGYRVMLYLAVNTLGDSEFGLRLPSALGGVLALAVAYALGRRLYSHTEGLLAAAGLAVAWAPIYYAQEARAYSLLMLLALLTTYFWLRMLSDLAGPLPLSRLAVGGYWLAAVAAAYLHYFGLYLVLLQALSGSLFLLARRPKALARIILVYAAVGLAYLPWLPTLWSHLTQGPIWIPPPAGLVPTALDYLTFVFSRSPALRDAAMALLVLALMVGLVGLARGLAAGRRGWRLFSPTWLLVLWLVVPLLGVYLKSTLSAPVLTTRNLIISLPAAYLLLARAVTVLAGRRWPALVAGALIVGVGLFQLIGPLRYYAEPHKGLFREAVASIASRDAQFPGALLIGYSWDAAYVDYYLRRLGSPRRVQVAAGNRPEIPAVLEALRDGQPRHVWYIRAFREPESEFMDFLRAELRQVDYQAFPGPEPWLMTEVWLFETAQP